MLYDSLRIGTLELKNRLVMPPMFTGRSRLGHVTDDLVAYYRERALGSAPGLIITEHSCITEQGRATAQQLSIVSEELIDEHRRITDAIHEADCRVAVQLNHAGNAAEPLDGGEIVSASAVPNPRKKLPAEPRPLTVVEIRDLEARYAEAAVRALKAGYDAVEIHCAHGYLLNQFYSPLTNLRTDDYGGGLENRRRFLMETVALVRSAVGSGCPLLVRLGGADYLPGGSTEEDAVETCRALEAAGVDLLDLSGGMCGYVRPDHPEAGYFGSMTEKIRAVVSVPVLLTGGVTRLSEAEALLAAGKADLIGVGRALYRDPLWAQNAE